MMLQADIRQLHTDVTLLPIHTCTQWRYITVLHYMSVPTNPGKSGDNSLRTAYLKLKIQKM